MSAYYSETPSDECIAVLRKGFIPGLSQDGRGVDLHMLEAMPKLCEAGHVCLYHEGNIVILLRRYSAWVGVIDIFVGDGGTIFEAIQVVKNFIEWAKANTFYRKLECRSPFSSAHILARRVGGKIEGIRRKSFRMPSGEMADEVECGYLLERN